MKKMINFDKATLHKYLNCDLSNWYCKTFSL
jgi:hypothetical protein